MKRLLFLVLVLALGFYIGWPAWSGYQIKTALDAGDAATLQNKIDFVSVRDSLRPAATHHAEGMLADALNQGGTVATVLDDRTKAAMLPKIVESTLNTVVTPENLIRIARHGGTIKDAVATIVKEQMSGSLGALSGLSNLGKLRVGGNESGEGGTDLDIGGLVGGIVGAATGTKQDGLGDLIGGVTGRGRQPETAPEPEPEPALAKTSKKPKFGLDNIKSFGFAGPLGLQHGVAQDPKAKQPDITAEMGFRGMDWKLVALRPKF